MTNQAFSRARTSITGLLFAAVLFTPFVASAATTKPSCTVTVTTSAGETRVKSNKKQEVTVNAGSMLTLAWSSTNAKTATLNGDEIASSGTSTSTPTDDKDFAFVFKNGSKKVKCTVEMTVVEPASFDAGSLTTDSTKPTLRGSAGGYKMLYLTVAEHDDDDSILTKKVSVKHGDWKLKLKKKLADGVYDVRLTDKSGDTVYVTDTLRVGDAPVNDSNVSLSLLPLLSGGTAHANQSIPVMYLVVRNTGKQAAHVTGITLREDGNAPTSLITMLTTVDDKGGSRGTSVSMPFSGTSATVPVDAVVPPGGVKIITVKAQLGATAAASGTQLMLNVTGVTTDGSVTAAFPVRGTTWTIAP